MKIPSDLTCPITPEQAYLNNVPDIPEGWEFVRFGCGLAEDEYLIPDKNREPRKMPPGHGDLNYPRIIVRKSTSPAKPHRWVVEARNSTDTLNDILRGSSWAGAVIGPVAVMQEVKPITSAQIKRALEDHRTAAGNIPVCQIEEFLKKLGIEVED